MYDLNFRYNFNFDYIRILILFIIQNISNLFSDIITYCKIAIFMPHFYGGVQFRISTGWKQTLQVSEKNSMEIFGPEREKTTEL